MAVGIEERQRADGRLMPRPPQRPVGRRRRIGTYLPVTLFVPGWVRIVRLSAARPRVFAVLRNHHTVERDLDRHRLLRDRVARANRVLEISRRPSYRLAIARGTRCSVDLLSCATPTS